MKDGLVRADTLPLVFRALGAEACRAARAMRVGGTDLLTLDLAAAPLARIDDHHGRRCAVVRRIETADAAGPLTLAIDLMQGAAGPPNAPEASSELTDAPPFSRLRNASLRPCQIALSSRSHARRAADACASSTRGLQPHVPGHAAGGHPRQLARRQAPTGAIAQATCRRRCRARPRDLAAAARRRMDGLGDSPDDARRRSSSCRRAAAAAGAPAPRTRAAAAADPARDQPAARSGEQRRQPDLRMLAEIEKRINEENAAQEALHQPGGDARGGLRASTTTSCAARSRPRGTRNFPEYQASSSTAS